MQVPECGGAQQPQELLLWSIFIGPVQWMKTLSAVICNLGLEVAQQPWHSPSWAEGSPGSISAAQGTGAVNPPRPRSVPPQHCCPLHRNCREGGQHLHSKDVLGLHLQIRVGNGFCLLHERETPTNLKPEMQWQVRNTQFCTDLHA